MANALAMRVEEMLRPVIGSVLASVSVDVESKRIGRTPDTLEHSDLNKMSENLVSALRWWWGRTSPRPPPSKVRELGSPRLDRQEALAGEVALGGPQHLGAG